MGLDTAIEWTDHTFNPWWGCARVSPGCRFCYADRDATRYGHNNLWRRHGERRMLSNATWANPVKWNRAAERAGKPAKVFCASMADVFEDHPAVVDARKRLWNLIETTPWLIWQLLTKRPENVTGMVPWGTSWPTNIWLGTSVEDQTRAAQRIPVVLDINGPRIRFLSCEPLLGPVTLFNGVFTEDDGQTPGPAVLTTSGRYWTDLGWEYDSDHQPGIDWVICGGESGPKARPMQAQWAVELRDECAAAGVPFLFKQAGAVLARQWGCKSRTGTDPAEWPEPFPREYPDAAAA